MFAKRPEVTDPAKAAKRAARKKRAERRQAIRALIALCAGVGATGALYWRTHVLDWSGWTYLIIFLVVAGVVMQVLEQSAATKRQAGEDLDADFDD